MSDPKQSSRALRDAGERARASLDQARQKATDVIAATREKGESVIEETREKTYRAAAETNRLFQEHPLAAVAAAAAAGAILGIFVPRLVLAGRVGKVARSAVGATVKSKAAQALWSNVREDGKSARAVPGNAGAASPALPEGEEEAAETEA